jgi:hypothetical protein
MKISAAAAATYIELWPLRMPEPPAERPSAICPCCNCTKRRILVFKDNGFAILLTSSVP